MTICGDSLLVEHSAPLGGGGSIPTSPLQLQKRDWNVASVDKDVALMEDGDPTVSHEARERVAQRLMLIDGNATWELSDGELEEYLKQADQVIAMVAPANNQGSVREATLRMVAGLFEESVHDNYTREEIVSIIEDMIRLGTRTHSLLCASADRT